ncbi:hypothetical protein, partial [Streptomyces sp. NPDC005476]|uniref:hypothetical protein n=1 Tax=Streptomyces sp. NPDC005476 TaxID=3156882 RepID=UPI00345198F6
MIKIKKLSIRNVYFSGFLRIRFGSVKVICQKARRLIIACRGFTGLPLLPISATDTGMPLNSLSQVCRPLLVVVDYAETRTPQL